MKYLSEKGAITTREYSKLIPKMSFGTLKRDLSNLVDMGLVKKVGSKKTRKYEVIKK